MFNRLSKEIAPKKIAQQQKQKITNQQYNKTLTDLRLNYLETQNTLDAGIERSFLKLNREFTDTASQVEDVFTNAFSSAEDALTDFVKTGKLEFGSLIDSLLNDLIRLSIQQTVLAPLSSALSGFGGFGGGGGGLVGPPAPGGGGLFGGIGDFFGGLFGFASGGSFKVGGAGGTDSQLVAFKATPNERVTIETPSQQQRNGNFIGSNVTVNVINNTGAGKVTTRERPDNKGGKSIDIVIDELVGNKIREFGSKTNQAINQTFAINPALRTR